MVDINYQQYKMLNKINKEKIVNVQNFSNDDIDICIFLCEKNFLSVKNGRKINSDGSINIFEFQPNEFAITQAGKAQISAYRHSFHEWWFSVIISLISLGVSILALLH